MKETNQSVFSFGSNDFYKVEAIIYKHFSYYGPNITKSLRTHPVRPAFGQMSFVLNADLAV
jgi:hypothetical protein